MAKVEKTSDKRLKNLKPGLTGNATPFTTDNQPSPDVKKIGWQEKRAERLLTQMILKKLTDGSTLDEYVNSLLLNAKLGNPKAIDTINKGIEDQVDKSEVKVETNIEKITFK